MRSKRRKASMCLECLLLVGLGRLWLSLVDRLFVWNCLTLKSID